MWRHPRKGDACSVSLSELEARVRALMRRGEDAATPMLSLGNLKFEDDGYQWFAGIQYSGVIPAKAGVQRLFIAKILDPEPSRGRQR